MIIQLNYGLRERQKMPDEHTYNREADDIDEFNREEAMKKKGEINFKLKAEQSE